MQVRSLQCIMYSAGNHHPSGIIIKGKSYSTIKLIGEGGYAFIYEGVNTATGHRVALKRHTFIDLHQQTQTIEEIHIYQSVCPHENIVTYIDSEIVYRLRSQLPEMWIVMEYCEGPSLQDYINNRLQLKQKFTPREVYELVDNMIHAIGHLHSQSPPVSHWDIKPDNFIFSDKGMLKLCDFGSASQIYYLPQNSDEIMIAENELDRKLTLIYRSPETLDLWAKEKIDTKVDVWALGVIIYILVFREMPFDLNRMSIIDAVPKRYKNNADSCPDEFKRLMEIVRTMMLVKNPDVRSDIFSVSEALSKITGLPTLERPRPGFLSAQRPRFQAL